MNKQAEAIADFNLVYSKIESALAGIREAKRTLRRFNCSEVSDLESACLSHMETTMSSASRYLESAYFDAAAVRTSQLDRISVKPQSKNRINNYCGICDATFAKVTMGQIDATSTEEAWMKSHLIYHMKGEICHKGRFYNKCEEHQTVWCDGCCHPCPVCKERREVQCG